MDMPVDFSSPGERHIGQMSSMYARGSFCIGGSEILAETGIIYMQQLIGRPDNVSRGNSRGSVNL